MTGLTERIASDSDPLRFLLRTAKAWRVPPTVLLGLRTVDTAGWTRQDTDYALALEDYEAGLCPGGDHLLAETSKREHDGAYRPNDPRRCHYCTAKAVTAKAAEKRDVDTTGVYFTFSLDPDVVALNQQPVPPLPPELGGP